MSDVIRFLLDGEPVAVSGVSPQTTLLEYLREQRGRTGTKEGCAEGDCGACTVMLAELDGDETLRWRPINACIRLLPTIDGKALFTVESLRSGGTLHPVQQALVESHASQCGFCTPGFVMSLFGLYKNAADSDRRAVDDALSGNLCRCTGYRPIIAAAQRMRELPPAPGWRGPGFNANGRNALSDEERALARRLSSLRRAGTLAYQCAGQSFFAPVTADALAALCATNPDARLVAGATDIGLWITKQHRDLGTLVYTGNVRELLALETTATCIEIGAAVSLSDAFAALGQYYPSLAEASCRFGSVPIRNSGTLGGNIANGSPIGDSMPILLALGATLRLRRGEARRELALEDFYRGYQKTALEPGEFLETIRVPRPVKGAQLRAYKLSKRFDQDISALFACFHLQCDGEGTDARITSIRIGCGGMAAIPKRALHCERALAGRRWDDGAVAAGQAALDDDFTPLSDLRASAAYRRAALKNLLRRFHIETTERSVKTRAVDYAA